MSAWLGKSEVIQREIMERLRSNYSLLKEFAGNTVFSVEGGWNAVLKIPANKNDEAWALELLEKNHVLVHPGYLFDFREEHYAVVSLLPPPETFREGIRTIQNAGF